jgi:hypothetical protein
MVLQGPSDGWWIVNDQLGFARFEQHRDWHGSGRVEGDVDDIEPRSFAVARQGDRWLLTTSDKDLVAVGDTARDLVATDGGLVRRPATRGFTPYLSSNLTRQIGVLSREFVGSCEVVGSRDSEHAGRSAVDLDLRDGTYDISLGVDAETGVWTWLRTSGFTVTVDELTIGPPDADAFDLLDLVPEIDLSRRVPISETLDPIVNTIRDASGLSVEVVYQNEEDGEFRLILVDDERVAQALITRSRAGSPQDPAICEGVQHWWDDETWNYHVDSVRSDHLWSGRIMKAIKRL